MDKETNGETIRQYNKKYNNPNQNRNEEIEIEYRGVFRRTGTPVRNRGMLKIHKRYQMQRMQYNENYYRLVMCLRNNL